MSTYWDICCRDCDETAGNGLGFWINHGSDELRHALDDVKSFRCLHLKGELLREMTFDTRTEGYRVTLADVAGYARKHDGHALGVRNEYGEWLGTCGKFIPCDHCGYYHARNCGLLPGHDGECVGE